MKNFYLLPIKGYQYISKMLPASCRYYPTCSEYASWQFEYNAPHRAFFNSTLRILRCNQFFTGGIDYPLARIDFSLSANSLSHNSIYSKIKIRYWFIPKNTNTDNKYYYIIKDFDAIKRST